MEKATKTKIRRLNAATHRDLGYFFSSLIIIYCLSGIALNHIDEWNPDFVITKKTIDLKKTYLQKELNDEIILHYSRLVGENSFKVYDSPTKDQVKIYFENASLHLNFSTRKGNYESVSRRPIFYHSNIIHRNNVSGWKWVSDIFALLLIVINVTGLFILKGKHGITGRGKWLMLAGTVPPIAILVIHELV
jgi:uncharacterized protein